MKGQRETIFRTTDASVKLRHEVGGLLPKAVSEIIPTEAHHGLCPFCGGVKLQGSVQCRSCAIETMRRAAKRARERGANSRGQRSAAVKAITRRVATERANSMSPTLPESAKVQMGHHARGGTQRAAADVSEYVKTKAGVWMERRKYEAHKHQGPDWIAYRLSGKPYACVECGEEMPI